MLFTDLTVQPTKIKLWVLSADQTKSLPTISNSFWKIKKLYLLPKYIHTITRLMLLT